MPTPLPGEWTGGCPGAEPAGGTEPLPPSGANAPPHRLILQPIQFRMKNAILLGVVAVVLAIVVAGFNGLASRRSDAPGDAGEKDALASPPARSAAAEAELRAARNDLRDALAELTAGRQLLTNFSERIVALESQLNQMSAVVTAVRESQRLHLAAPSASPPPRRSWGPEQATGPPDTFQAGDFSTAWAARTPDGGHEWLRLEFTNAVDVAEVHVYESYNPGAIAKVTAFQGDDREITLWEGVEPEAAAPVVRMFAAPFPARINAVKIYLDTRRVSGWNEIDAVELIGRDGSRQWAAVATASSTFAEPSPSP